MKKILLWIGIGLFLLVILVLVAAQTPALDAVSGATADKNAFLKAVEIALENGLS